MCNNFYIVKDFFGNLLLAVASLLICLLVLEGGFRLLLPEKKGPDGDKFHSVMTIDSRVGEGFKPNSETAVASQFQEFNTEYKFNELGLRDNPLPTDPDTFRLFVMGNSFVEGWGIDLDQSYLKVAERILNASGGKKIVLLNGGHSSYGVAQSYIQLKDLWDRAKPDAVVLFYISTMVQSDHTFLEHAKIDWQGIAQSVDNEKLAHEIENRQKKTAVTASVPGWLKALAKYSAFAHFFESRLSNHFAQQQIIAGNTQTDMLAGYRSPPEFLPKVHELSLRHIQASQIFLRAHRTPFLVIFIPMPHQLSGEEWAMGRKAYGLENKMYGMPDKPVVEKYLSEHHIPYIAAQPVFQQMVAQAKAENTKAFYTYDFHMSPWGHQYLGKWFAGIVQEKFLAQDQKSK